MNIFFPFLRLISVALLIKGNLSNKDCKEWTQEHVFNSTEFHTSHSEFTFLRIDSLQDLDLTFDSCTQFEINPKPVLKIYSNRKILLDNNLSFNNVFKLFTGKSTVLFQNIKGFNQKQTFATNNSPIAYHGVFDFIDVYFDFYQNDTLLTEDKCKRDNFDPNMKSFFGEIQYLFLIDNVFYNRKVCPYVFFNAKFRLLTFCQITNSLIFRNRLEFLEINETDDFDLKINSLQVFQMNIAYETVSLKNFNKLIFKKYFIKLP